MPQVAKPTAAAPKAKKAAAPKAVASNGDLTKAELRVVSVIAKAKGPLTRKQVAGAVAKLGIACYNDRISNESKTYAKLIAGGYVKQDTLEIDGVKEVVHSITAKGKKTVEKA